jgi:hypothetical protein
VPGVIRWAGDLTRQLFTYLRELSLRLNHAFTDDNAGLKTIADADLTEAEATLLTDIADGTTTVVAIENGTWTPEIHGTTGDPTYTKGSWHGSYQKIGKQVFVTFALAFSAYSGGSGTLQITGLPYDPATNDNMSGGAQLTFVDLRGTVPANYAGMQGCIATDTYSTVYVPGLRLIYALDTGRALDLPTNALGAGTWLIGFGLYVTT